MGLFLFLEERVRIYQLGILVAFVVTLTTVANVFLNKDIMKTLGAQKQSVYRLIFAVQLTLVSASFNWVFTK